MNKLKTIITAFIFSLSIASPLMSLPTFAATPSPLSNIDTKQEACTGSGGDYDTRTKTCNSSTGGADLTTIIANIVSVLLFIIGAVAVIMIIIGAFRFVLSAGDPAAAKGARNTILYAVVGLVVAIAAYAIVRFVLNNFKA